MNSELHFRNGTVAVGDVFVSSWGYEQTNVNFYQVVALHGKTMVTIREIMAQICGTDTYLQEKKPVLSAFCSEPMKRKVHDYADTPIVVINDCIRAYKTGTEEGHIFTTWG